MFVLWSLERILLFLRFVLTSLAIIGGFAERLAPATWKRGCTIDLLIIVNQIAQKLQEMFSSDCQTCTVVYEQFYVLKLRSLIQVFLRQPVFERYITKIFLEIVRIIV